MMMMMMMMSVMMMMTMMMIIMIIPSYRWDPNSGIEHSQSVTQSSDPSVNRTINFYFMR